MIAVQSYSANQYNALPVLPEARKRFREVDGAKAISGKFLDLFRRHGVDKTFGLAMIHRHFELNEEERMVEFRGTSVPWAEVEDPKETGIKASNWEVTNEGVRPYEFKLDTSPNGIQEVDFEDPKVQSFVKEFMSVVDGMGAMGLFGLCEYPGDDFQSRLEITEGRANINLPYNDYKNLPNVDAAWFFSPELYDEDEGCKCKCEVTGTGGEIHTRHGGHRHTV